MPKNNVLRPLALAVLLVLAGAPVHAAGRAERRPAAAPAAVAPLEAAWRSLLRLWEGIVPESLAAGSGEAAPGAAPSENVEDEGDKGADIDPDG